MIDVEKRPVPAIKVVTRSGAMTQVQNKEKEPNEAWVRKTPEKIPASMFEGKKVHLWKQKKTLLIREPQ